MSLGRPALKQMVIHVIFLLLFQAVNGFCLFFQPTTHNLYKAVWIGSRFVCVGDSGTIVMSIDGRTWTTANPGSAADLTAVAPFDSMIITLSRNPASGLRSAGYIADMSIQKFSAASFYYPSEDNFVQFKQATYVLNSFQYSIELGLSITLGRIAQYKLQNNKAGETIAWNPKTSAPYYVIASIAGSPSRIVGIGYFTSPIFPKEAPRYPIIISSSDGLVWDTLPSPGNFMTDRIYWTGDYFVGCGQNGLLFSSDGINWKTRPGGMNLSSLFYSSSAGYTMSWKFDAYWYGSGKIITSASITSQQGNDSKRYHTQLLATGATPVDSSSDYYLRYYSQIKVNGCAISSNTAIVVGDYGQMVRYSFAEKKWTPFGIGTDTDLNSICWNGNTFVVVGDNGLIAVSSDGITWEQAAITLKNTTLSGTINNENVILEGTISIAAPCTLSHTAIIQPGATFRMAPGAWILFNNLTALGTKRDSIRFQALDPARPWGGLTIQSGKLDYCTFSGGCGKTFDSFSGTGGFLFADGNVALSHSLIIAPLNSAMPCLYANDGSLTISTTIVKGSAHIGANAGAGYSVCNSLFADSTRCTVYGIQNNYPSSGSFVNCTFASGCSMSARTSYGIYSVSIIAENCAFVDNIAAIKSDSLNKVSFTNCLSGDSLFVDAPGKNYHLRPQSIAIDHGNGFNSCDTMDLDGNRRIYGTAVDVGAYEFWPNNAVKFRTDNRVPASFSYTVFGRNLMVAVPEDYRGACSIEILNCAGELLRHRDFSQSESINRHYTFQLPKKLPGVILIRLAHNGAYTVQRIIWGR